jgi:uncharacterized protein
MDVMTTLAGEAVTLLPEKAIYWPGERTLFVADVHWGKAAAFRALSVPVPGGTTTADLERLSRALDRTQAERLVVLGDLLHARAGRQPETLAAISAWRNGRPELSILLVRGNHDESAGDPPVDWRIEVVDEPYLIQPFALRHYPDPSDLGYVLAGHVHPAAYLSGRGGQGLRLPCFLCGPQVAILPAFSSFAGAKVVQPTSADSLYVVAEDEVIPILTASPTSAAGNAIPGARLKS